MAENQDQVAGLLNYLPEGVCLIDSDGHIQIVNPPMKNYLLQLADGFEKGDRLSHIGKHTIQELLSSPEETKLREIQGPNNQIYEVSINFTLAKHPDQGLVIMCRDVTEDRAIKLRSEQQDRLAAVGQLAAGIAHDFNNLLTVMMGTAQLVDLQTDLPDQVRKDLKNIYTQGQRATHLIQQVMDFSRKTVATKTALDVVPFFKETVKMLERTIPEIKIQFQVNSQKLFVNANLVQLQQVITNLAVNARDAMPTGGTLSIALDRIQIPQSQHVLPELTPGNWIHWKVCDTGIGMSLDVIKRIYEPFFTTKEPGRGTGLGLSQVFGIIKQHGGEITVESQEGKGTCFSIYLPETHPPPPNTKHSQIKTQKGQGETLLVVEDDMGVIRLTRKFLEILNYRIIEAHNGQEALHIMDQHHKNIDLILSDMVMPETGGLTLVKKLRDKGYRTPILMMSGYPLGENLKAYSLLQIAGWLTKPLDLNELAEHIKKTLAKT